MENGTESLEIGWRRKDGGLLSLLNEERRAGSWNPGTDSMNLARRTAALGDPLRL
jgi:hypothetical protein